MVDRKRFDGLEVTIERPKGTIRTGTNKKGEKWSQKMTAHYGYILGTNSPDGEKLDCYLIPGPKRGDRVYVIHQLSLDGDKYDEDKVILNARSAAEAKRVWLDHMPSSKMFGGISCFGMEHFKAIAYQASKSKCMLANQREYDNLKGRGLVQRGILDPITVAKRVSESRWTVVSRTTGEEISRHDTRELAESRISSMVPSVAGLYEVSYDGDERTVRILTEGLAENDLEGLVIGRISFDEYVPKDEDSDNVVIAFFVRNCPDAVQPLAGYCSRCRGVYDTDTGDSDTMENTSIVYVEMERKDLDIQNILDLVKEVSSLAAMSPSDFHITLPHIDKRYPFDRKVLEQYLSSRIKLD